ncbi:MAG TPA: trigger factor [Actinomycetota bacterium]|nr:trigger factor [Actinomycetota bacterium]
MQTTVEATEKHKVKLTIEVPPEDFGRDLDRAYRKIAEQVKIPGFRKGKVPRKVIDAQIGRETVLEEFLGASIPDYYESAMREQDLAPITDPDISLEQVEEGKPLVFTAEVEIRPRLELAGYKGVSVERPAIEVTEHEVDDLTDRLRERFAELEPAPRAARSGDFVVADLRATVHDEEVPEATRPDGLYEIGSGSFVPELDKELEGKRAGEIVKFNATLPDGFAGDRGGQEVSFQVLVKEVKAKRLPAADDAFAKTASEFDTLGELRESLKETIARNKDREADHVVRDRVLQALIDRVAVELPDTLVDEETERRVQNARERAAAAGTTMEQVLDSQGWDELRLRSDARGHAIKAIKGDLVLEAVARAEKLEVGTDELATEVKAIARSFGKDVKEVATALDRSGQIVALAGDIIRSKALDLLVEHAEITQEGEKRVRDEAPTSVEEPSVPGDDQSEEDS